MFFISVSIFAILKYKYWDNQSLYIVFEGIRITTYFFWPYNIIMLLNCLVVSCIFGVCPLIEKHILKYIEIESFLILCAFLFFILALLYTILVHQPKLIKDLDNLNKHTHIYGYILLFVILFYVLAGYIYLNMLHQHRMTHVTSIVATFPIITAIIAFLFLDEDINAMQMIGAMVAVTGVAILEYKN